MPLPALRTLGNISVAGAPKPGPILMLIRISFLTGIAVGKILRDLSREYQPTEK